MEKMSKFVRNKKKLKNDLKHSKPKVENIETDVFRIFYFKKWHINMKQTGYKKIEIWLNVKLTSSQNFHFQNIVN